MGYADGPHARFLGNSKVSFDKIIKYEFNYSTHLMVTALFREFFTKKNGKVDDLEIAEQACESLDTMLQNFIAIGGVA